MNSSFVQKQIAKSISLLRYIPEHQLYQVSIDWEHGCTDTISSLHYLPEIFLYPYAIKRQSELQQKAIVKVSESHLCIVKDNDDTSLELQKSHQEEPDLTCLTGKELQRRGTLDYDALVKRADIAALCLKRNKEICWTRQPKETKKKRKT